MGNDDILSLLSKLGKPVGFENASKVVDNSLLDPNILGGVSTVNNSSNMFDGLMSFLNNPDSLRGLNQGVGALGGLFNIYSGIKGLNQSKDLFNTQKAFATTNLANEAKLTNERLSTRQGSRLRSQGLSEEQIAQGVADFMKQYGVSGSIGG